MIRERQGRPGVQVRKQSMQVCLQVGNGASLNEVHFWKLRAHA